VDQEQEDQAAKTNSRRRESEPPLDGVRRGPPARYEEENLLEGSGASEVEEALNQAGRIGAINTDAPLTE
jgi:hypothetical protein